MQNSVTARSPSGPPVDEIQGFNILQASMFSEMKTLNDFRNTKPDMQEEYGYQPINDPGGTIYQISDSIV